MLMHLNTSLLHKLITINQYMSKVEQVFALGSILQTEFFQIPSLTALLCSSLPKQDGCGSHRSPV